MYSVNHMKINVMTRLNAVWNMATWKTGECNPMALQRLWTALVQGLKVRSTRMTPNALKTVWERAAREAIVPAPFAAILPLNVVPMLVPSTIAAALEKSIHPRLMRIIVIATVGEECSIHPHKMPIIK